MNKVTKEKGFFKNLGEFLSCLIAQKDKKAINFLKRYKVLTKYIIPAVISLGLIGISSSIGGFAIITLPLGLIGTVTTAAAIIGKVKEIKNSPKEEASNIKKGTYFENLDNARKNLVQSFRKNKKQEIVLEDKKDTKEVVVEVKEEKNINDLEKIKKIINNLDLEVIDLDKFLWLEGNANFKNLLNELDLEYIEKYNEYQNKAKLLIMFKKLLENVNIDDNYSRCQYIFDELGEEFISKNVDKTILEKFKNYNKDEVVEEVKEIKEVKKITLDYIKFQLNIMNSFNLETTYDSVYECEKLLDNIDLFIPVDDKVKENDEYKKLWEKYNSLKESLQIKKNVLSFVDKINSIDKVTDVSYEEFCEISDIVDKFTDKEWQDLECLDKADEVLKRYRSILKNSRDLILRHMLENADVKKDILDNNYSELSKIIEVADMYDDEARKNKTKKPSNMISDSKEKLEQIREILNGIRHNSDYSIELDIVFDSNKSLTASYVDYSGNERNIQLETKYIGDINDIFNNIKKEIKNIEPFVSEDKIIINSFEYSRKFIK